VSASVKHISSSSINSCAIRTVCCSNAGSTCTHSKCCAGTSRFSAQCIQHTAQQLQIHIPLQSLFVTHQYSSTSTVTSEGIRCEAAHERCKAVSSSQYAEDHNDLIDEVATSVGQPHHKEADTSEHYCHDSKER
jgi:hypothetical protein